jgi:DNA-binding NtrC family response regulator
MKPQISFNTFNLKEIEKEIVIAAIKYTEGNVQYARELLNVSKATIYRLIDVYHIDVQELRDKRNWGWKTIKEKT